MNTELQALRGMLDNLLNLSRATCHYMADQARYNPELMGHLGVLSYFANKYVDPMDRSFFELIPGVKITGLTFTDNEDKALQLTKADAKIIEFISAMWGINIVTWEGVDQHGNPARRLISVYGWVAAPKPGDEPLRMQYNDKVWSSDYREFGWRSMDTIPTNGEEFLVRDSLFGITMKVQNIAGTLQPVPRDAEYPKPVDWKPDSWTKLVGPWPLFKSQ